MLLHKGTDQAVVSQADRFILQQQVHVVARVIHSKNGQDRAAIQ